MTSERYGRQFLQIVGDTTHSADVVVRTLMEFNEPNYVEMGETCPHIQSFNWDYLLIHGNNHLARDLAQMSRLGPIWFGNSKVNPKAVFVVTAKALYPCMNTYILDNRKESDQGLMREIKDLLYPLPPPGVYTVKKK